MRIKIFGKNDCSACAATKQKFEFFLKKWNLEDSAEIVFYDLDTVDGLVEGSLLNAMDVPTTVLEKEGKEIARWEKAVPTSSEFKEHFFTADDVNVHSAMDVN